VDIRARVCIGGSEMRVRFELQDRKQPMGMSVDAQGVLAQSGWLALEIVSKFKGDKLHVDRAHVKLEEPHDCSRAEGKDERPRVDAQKRESPAKDVGKD
jgi:hypothetical protein